MCIRRHITSYQLLRGYAPQHSFCLTDLYMGMGYAAIFPVDSPIRLGGGVDSFIGVYAKSLHIGTNIYTEDDIFLILHWSRHLMGKMCLLK